MERMLRLSVAVVLSLSIVACGSDRPVTGEEAGILAAEAAAASAQAAAAARNVPNGPKLTVMTRNLYLGADIAPLTTAETGLEAVAAASQIWVDVHRTDFPARARVLADEVFWARPEVLGLQEVTLYRTGDPLACGETPPPSPPVATDPELDFLAILQEELRHRGLRYEVAAQVTTMDVELCILDALRGGEPRDLRYTDRDVLLVRKDVHWRNPTLPASQPIEAFIPAELPPGEGDGNGGVYAVAVYVGDDANSIAPATAFFEVPKDSGNLIYSWRGWTAVEVARGNRWVRVFETHVEDRLDALTEVGLPTWYFQALQDPQLLAIVGASLEMAPMPAIVLGDFNVYRQPLGDLTMYELLTGEPLGLVDAWTALRPGDDGFTWGFDPLLTSGELGTTLDLVLATDGLHPISTYLVGTRDLTPGGLHPSDHAGIVTTFSIR
jgi:hypothetical protein